MKHLIFSLITFLFSFFSMFAQQVDWTYRSPGGSGLDQAFCITPCASGGCLFAGRTGPVGINAGDFYISKIDADGSFQWSKTYAGTSMDEARAIRELPDGSIIIAGATVAFGDVTGSTANLHQLILMKLNAAGDTLWTKRYGGPGSDTGDALELTDDGGFIVAGRYTVQSPNNDFYIVRTDANGDTLWTKKYGGPNADFARAIARTADNGFVVAGTTRSFGPNPASGNIWLLRLTAMGDTLWSRAIGTSADEEGYSVAATAEGGYILAGRTGSESSRASDIYIVKTDGNGVVQWAKTYDGGDQDNDGGRAILQTPDGGYALAGYIFSDEGPFGSPLLYLLRTDENGNKLWDLQQGNSNSPNGAKGYALLQNADGTFIVAGENDQGNSGIDMRAYIVKISDPTLGTEDRALSLAATVFPNPFAGSATLLLPAEIKGNVRIEVYSVNGQLCLRNDFTTNPGQVLLPGNIFSPGIYFYSIRTGDAVAYRGKMVVGR